MKKACAIVLASLMLSGCAATLDGSGLSSQSAGPIRGIGYATVSNQPGKTAAQKQLMAIRASRLMAMRDLAEKIHGMNIDAYSSLAETTMLADTTRATVQGLVRGARVVSITPTRSNVYETILEIGPETGQIASNSVAGRGEPNFSRQSNNGIYSSTDGGPVMINLQDAPKSSAPNISDIKNKSRITIIGNTIIRPDDNSTGGN